MKRFSFVRAGTTLSYCADGPGSGRCIVLQHALTSDASSYIETGIVGELAEAGFRCILPDALGHGYSALVPVSARHGLVERSRDVLAVLDHAGVRSAAFAGYSMGAWIGTGLLAHAPDRFVAFSFGGWDLRHGARDFSRLTDNAMRRAEFIQLARTLSSGTKRPASCQQIEGYADTYAHLFDDLPPLDCLISKRPIAIAIGRGDPYAPSCRIVAEGFGTVCDVLPGDHVSSFWSRQYRQHVLAWATHLDWVEN